MNPAIYDDMALEEIANKQFGVKLDIKEVIARNIPTSHTSIATVFITSKMQVYAYVSGRAPLTLGDVRKMVKRMGLLAEAYLPPKHEAQYFEKIAESKFRDVFPGRHVVNDQDLHFYRLLVPYNPALVLIAEINGGIVKQFDPSDSTSWRTAAKFAYKRIKAA